MEKPNQFIKLTRSRNGVAVFVNVSSILYFNDSSGKTSIKFGTDKDYAVIIVQESPEEVLALIQGK